MAEMPKNRKRFWWRVAILSAIAIGVVAVLLPNFAICGGPAGYRNACINNLLEIDRAKKRWAMNDKVESGAPIVEVELAKYIKGGVLPQCPEGGKYKIGKVGEEPRCTLSGHAIPPR
jgi:hypothetical protein